MKIKFFLYLIFLLIPFVLFSQQNKIFSGEKYFKDKLNALQGTSNEGKEFWITFNPSLESSGFGNGHKIYFFSQFETQVMLEIPGKGHTQQIQINPNEVKEIILSAAVAQCYRKSANQRPSDEIYYEGDGIHITSDKPILVYALTVYNQGSDGYLAMPITAYGRNYVISSWYDYSDNSTLYYPGYVAIIASYDLTTVTFTLGGNPSTRTNTGLIPGGEQKKALFKGDVLLISSSGNMADLSGSRISATKPVVVITSNYYTHIPQNLTSNDLLTDIELPISTWDNQYLIIPFFSKAHLPVIRVYAKEPNTIIYRNNIAIDTLSLATYMENDAFLTINDNLTLPRPELISSNKPIYVKQYNRSQDDEGTPGDPFMFSVIPFRQQLKEYSFCTAGVTNTLSFNNYYLNIAYIPDDSGKVPLDFELGTVTPFDSVNWQILRSYDPALGTPFSVPINGKIYHSKTFEIRAEGMYKIRANQSFPAYIYGTSSNLAYGYPVGQNYLDLEKNDTLPPQPQFDIECDGSVNKAYIEDMPRTNPSKLLEIEIDTLQSFNYNFTYSNFVPGEDYRTRWDANVIDKSNDAKAVITFYDRSGNDTTISLIYQPGKLTINPTLDFEEVPVGKTVEKDFWVINNSDKNPFTITKYQLQNQNQGYELFTANLPITLQPLDSVNLKLKYTSMGCGVSKNMIEIGDSCYLASNNSASALSYILTAKPDLDFGNLPIGTFFEKEINIYNESIIPARLDSLAMKFGNKGFSIIANNPNQIISPFDSVRVSIRFNSTLPGSFNDSLGVGDSCGFHNRLEFKANSFKVSVQPNIFFDRLTVGLEKEKDAWVVNESDQYTFTLDTLVFKNNNQGFAFRDITFPYNIPPTEAAHFYVVFNASEEGTFTDSIGISAFNLLAYSSEVKADVISSVEEMPGDGNCQKELCIESVIPNPAETNSVDIILTKNITGSVQLNIYNELGVSVIHSIIETKTHGRYLLKLNISNLQSGIYFMECKIGEIITREKLIIQR